MNWLMALAILEGAGVIWLFHLITRKNMTIALLCVLLGAVGIWFVAEMRQP